MTIFYRSFDDCYRDVMAWEPHIPEISAVAGVPRSGLHVAAMIGQIRHIPVIPIDALTRDIGQPYRPRMARKLTPAQGRILLVDDTSHGGYQMKSIRGQLKDPDNVILAALYATDRVLVEKIVDMAGYCLPCRHHTFAWNCFRDAITPTLATDMDGVLAGDYHGPTPESRHVAEYTQWMRSTPCLVRPLKPVQAIVTARIEPFRNETEEWLRRHKIDYRELWMRPDYGVRDVAAWKSSVYRELANRVSVYVESEYWLAKAISDTTKYPTICWKSQTTFRGRRAEPLF